MEFPVRYLEGGIAVLQLEGTINIMREAAVRDAIASLVSQGHHRVVVDLASVSFLDSAGLGALIGGLKAARQAGGDLRISGPRQQVQLVLSLTNMDTVLPPYLVPEDAFPDV